jgi:DNA-binding winged helix-turn-helix (wHTH) protein
LFAPPPWARLPHGASAGRRSPDTSSAGESGAQGCPSASPPPSTNRRTRRRPSAHDTACSDAPSAAACAWRPRDRHTAGRDWQRRRDDDELTILRAYESGSDHHLADHAGYLLLRAVLATLTRRTLETITSRHLQIGQIHIDLAARTVDVDDTPAGLSRLEFELLVKFAGDPTRVFSKHELARCIWRQQQIKARTVDSHVTRLRHQLVDAGAGTVLVNKWGHGWALTTPH